MYQLESLIFTLTTYWNWFDSYNLLQYLRRYFHVESWGLWLMIRLLTMMTFVSSIILLSSLLLSPAYAFAASSASPSTKLQLKYFDIRGAAETCKYVEIQCYFLFAWCNLYHSTTQSPQCRELVVALSSRIIYDRENVLVFWSDSNISQHNSLCHQLPTAKACGTLPGTFTHS